MQLYPLRLVTIVGESVIMPDIARKGLELGASGYTLSEVLGRGSRNTRSVILNGEWNTMKCEFVVDDDVATKILTHVSEDYFDNYACIAWLPDVETVRRGICCTSSAEPPRTPPRKTSVSRRATTACEPVGSAPSAATARSAKRRA